MEFVFSGVAFEWRGPAPFLFVALSPEATEEIRAAAKELSYGWGCIPVTAMIGETSFTTSLMPREGQYLLPLKGAVQRAEGLEIGSPLTANILLDR